MLLLMRACRQGAVARGAPRLPRAFPLHVARNRRLLSRRLWVRRCRVRFVADPSLIDTVRELLLGRRDTEIDRAAHNTFPNRWVTTAERGSSAARFVVYLKTPFLFNRFVAKR